MIKKEGLTADYADVTDLNYPNNPRNPRLNILKVATDFTLGERIAG